MNFFTQRRKLRNNWGYRTCSKFILFALVTNLVLPPVDVFAQALPVPGTMLFLSSAYTPTMIKGMQLSTTNPLEFSFIVNTGDAKLQGDALKNESSKLIRYFLSALTVPEQDLWVNLSPYEKDRIIADGLGTTEMGRDMLSQDYILKQLTASLIYPEGEVGKKFWAKVRKESKARFGTDEVPVNTFNKVWIVPKKATLFEKNGTVLIVENQLKVMLEEDYVALQKGSKSIAGSENKETNALGSQIVREIVLPQLEKEINTGKHFANLRQITNAVLLASWYKENLKQSILGQVYVDKNKVKGVDLADKNMKLKIYEQYLEAFKKGAYNYIKEEYDAAKDETTPKKYFSGGTKIVYSSSSGVTQKTTDIRLASNALKEGGDTVVIDWLSVENLAQGQGAELQAAAGNVGSSGVKGQDSQIITAKLPWDKFFPAYDHSIKNNMAMVEYNDGNISTGILVDVTPAGLILEIGFSARPITKDRIKFVTAKVRGSVSSAVVSAGKAKVIGDLITGSMPGRLETAEAAERKTWEDVKQAVENTTGASDSDRARLRGFLNRQGDYQRVLTIVSEVVTDWDQTTADQFMSNLPNSQIFRLAKANYSSASSAVTETKTRTVKFDNGDMLISAFDPAKNTTKHTYYRAVPGRLQFAWFFDEQGIHTQDNVDDISFRKGNTSFPGLALEHERTLTDGYTKITSRFLIDRGMTEHVRSERTVSSGEDVWQPTDSFRQRGYLFNMSTDDILKIISLPAGAIIFGQDPQGRDVEQVYKDKVFTPEAMRLLKAFANSDLPVNFYKEDEIHRLEVAEKQARGEGPNFLPADGKLRWTDMTVARARAGDYEGPTEIPADMREQYIHLTGNAAKSYEETGSLPRAEARRANLRNLLHAYYSLANGWMADSEDALARLGTMGFDNAEALIAGILRDAEFWAEAETVAKEYVRDGKRTQEWFDTGEWKKLILDKATTRLFRPRGGHLEDHYIKFKDANGEVISMPAGIVDMIIYFGNIGDELIAQDSTLGTYLAKMNGAGQAALWKQAIEMIQKEKGWKPGTIKVIVLIEQLEAMYELAEIRAVLGDSFLGFDTGRWDYIASVILQMMWDHNWVPPNFTEMIMTYPFLFNGENRVFRAVEAPDRNGNKALWFGGMEPQIPVVKGNADPEDIKKAIRLAMDIAAVSKLREALAVGADQMDNVKALLPLLLALPDDMSTVNEAQIRSILDLLKTMGRSRVRAAGTWVAHPGMVVELKKVYEKLHAAYARINALGLSKEFAPEVIEPLDYTPEAAAKLVELRRDADGKVTGKRTITELRALISVAMQYVNAFLTGRGAAALKPADLFSKVLALFIMEDVATAEGRTKLSRIWAMMDAEFTDITAEERANLPEGFKTATKASFPLLRAIIKQEFDKLMAADNAYVFDSSKTNDLPIARMVIEKFVLSDTTLPWLIDLMNIVKGEKSLERATAKVETYEKVLKATNGRVRLTGNPEFKIAASAVSEDSLKNISNGQVSLLLFHAYEKDLLEIATAKDTKSEDRSTDAQTAGNILSAVATEYLRQQAAGETPFTLDIAGEWTKQLNEPEKSRERTLQKYLGKFDFTLKAGTTNIYEPSERFIQRLEEAFTEASSSSILSETVKGVKTVRLSPSLSDIFYANGVDKGNLKDSAAFVQAVSGRLMAQDYRTFDDKGTSFNFYPQGMAAIEAYTFSVILDGDQVRFDLQSSDAQWDSARSTEVLRAVDSVVREALAVRGINIPADQVLFAAAASSALTEAEMDAISNTIRKPVIGYNLKGELLGKDLDALLDGIANDYSANPVDALKIDVIVGVAFGYIRQARQKVDALVKVNKVPEGFIKIAAQNLRVDGLGAYTGYAPSIAELKDLGADAVILGHSELTTTDLGDPRIVETDEQVNEKVQAAIKAKLKVILAYGETLAERQAGQVESSIDRMLNGRLNGITGDQMLENSLVLAYEPVWSIGPKAAAAGMKATPQQGQDAIRYSRKWVAVNKTEEAAANTSIEYGGSMSKDNAAQFSAMPDIDGGLIGGASKKAETAIPIYRQFANVKGERFAAARAASSVSADPSRFYAPGVQVVAVDDEKIEDQLWGTAGARWLIRTVKLLLGLDTHTLDQVSRQAAGAAEEILTRIENGEYTPINGKKTRIFVGFDARKDFDKYAERIAKVTAAYKDIEVVFGEEILPTPMVARLTQRDRKDAFDFAWHVTASHNQLGWIGIKWLDNGHVNEDSWTVRFQQKANAKKEYPLNADVKLATMKIVDSMTAEYFNEVFPGLEEQVRQYRASKPDIQLTVDFMHGAMAQFSEFFQRMGVTVVRDTPMRDIDFSKEEYQLAGGKKVGYAPDPTQKAFYGNQPAYQKFEREAPDGSMYFLTDGDGDRLVTLVKKNGQVRTVKPNQFGPMAADFLLVNKLVPDDTIIGRTYVTTAGMDAVAKKHNKRLVIVPVGSKYFNPYIKIIALEESGHFVAPGHFDDTLYQAGLIFKMITQTGKDLFTLMDESQDDLGFKGVDNRADYENVGDDIMDKFRDPITGTPDEIQAKSARIVAEVTRRANKRLLEALVVVERADGYGGEVVPLSKFVDSLFTPEPLRIEQSNRGLIIRFDDLSWGGARLSGTANTGRVYTEGSSTEEERATIENALLTAFKLNEGAESASSGISIYTEDDDAVSASSALSLGDSISKMAEFIGRNKQAVVVEAMARSLNLRKVLDDFAESVGIPADMALKQMIAAGVAQQTLEQKGLEYSLTADFAGKKQLEALRQALTQASQNPAMVDLTVLRLERIILSAVDVKKFFLDDAFPVRKKGDQLVNELENRGAFLTLVAVWNFEEEGLSNPGDRVAITAKSLIDPSATDYYKQRGIDVQFTLPEGTTVGKNALWYAKYYQNLYGEDMAQGEFNYRGTGTRQTVEQFFNDHFMKVERERILSFVRAQFPDGIETFITNGIGANDQFMWALVEMYNRNRKEGDPKWIHVITSRDLEQVVSGLNPEKTLAVHISRSGSTWEGVEVASRLAAKGVNKMIVLANGGDLKAIADQANKEKPGTALLIGMQPDIGGRNMHRKTSIYYTAQTIAGLFVPQMDAPVFAQLNHEFDVQNDFSRADSLALNAAKFLHTMIKLKGVNHIAFMSNTDHTGVIGSELSQYVMEGSNKEDVISWGDHKLGSEPANVLQTLANGPAGEHTIGIAILDKASPNFAAEQARVAAVKGKMAVIEFVIDSRQQNTQQLKGVRPEQQAAFDILWTDFITALTTYLRVDANSNPNVKVVRGLTGTYVQGWKDVAQRYSTDAIGTGEAKVLFSVGQPGDSEIGVPEKQTALTLQNAEAQGRALAQKLSQQQLLAGRDRLNVFVGTENLRQYMGELRNSAYGSDLAKEQGWIFETGMYPGRAHKAHEATLAFSADPRKPLLANISVNIFLNQRSLGKNPYYAEPFVDKTGTGKYKGVEGATVAQTNDSMTFPNIQRTAQVSPTVLFEFQEATPEIQNIITAFYAGLIDEIGKIKNDIPRSFGGTDVSSSGVGRASAPVSSDTIKAKPVGGINLDPKLYDLQIKRDGQGVPLPMPQQPINMKIEGFFPIIINITPVSAVQLLSEIESSTPIQQASI